MRKLRQVTINAVLEHLDRCILTRHAFEATFNEEKAIVSISLRDRPDMHFRVVPNYDPESDEEFAVESAPSVQFLDGETTLADTFTDTFGELDEWTARVVQELSVKPAGAGGYADLRKALDEAADGLDSPSEPFDAAEAQQWEHRLDDLVAQFDGLKEKAKVSQRELNELKEEVRKLKAQLPNLPRRTWMKAAGGRILQTFERLGTSPVVQKTIESVVRGLTSGEG